MVHVDVLDKFGNSCKPGEIGRVVANSPCTMLYYKNNAYQKPIEQYLETTDKSTRFHIVTSPYMLVAHYLHGVQPPTESLRYRNLVPNSPKTPNNCLQLHRQNPSTPHHSDM